MEYFSPCLTDYILFLSLSSISYLFLFQFILTIQLSTMHENNSRQTQSLLSAPTGPSNPPNDDNSQQFELTGLQKIIDKVGGEHSYQFKSSMIFNLMWFLASWVLVGQSFFFDSSYQCNQISNKDECQKFICQLKANERAAFMTHTNSITFAFDDQYFICENQYLVPVLTSLLYLGSLLGFFVIPYIADNWGRKIGLRISWGLFVIGIIFITAANSPSMIGIGQLFTGFGVNPAITLCYSFLNEQVLRKKRQYYGLVIQVFLGLGQCTIALVFLPRQSWRIICGILLGMGIICFFLINYLLETPKFLLSKTKKEVLEVLNIMAKRNGKELIQQHELDEISVVDSKQKERITLFDLFRYKSLRWSTIATGFVFFAIQIIYYGTLLNLDHIGYEKLINQQIIGISEISGFILAEIIISKIKRKKWSLIGLGLASIFCFVLSILTIFQTEDNKNIMQISQTAALVCNRLILCAFWGLFYIYIGEIFPTRVRSLGFGWASALGQIGSFFAPYMIYFSDKVHINSWIPPGVFGLMGFAFIFCLNQTYRNPLYDDIEQVRISGKWDLSDGEQEQSEGSAATPKKNEKQAFQ